MIRTVWVGLVIAGATFYYGLIAIGAAIFRARGEIYSWATREWARAIIRASGIEIRAEGLENLERDAPQIIVANHVSGYDIFALASVLPVRFSFVAKKELERIPFFGTAWKAAGHISIDRSNRQKAIASLRQAGRKIREENSTVIIFAEGTRSRTGELLPFKKGAFTLALEAAVPIIPTALIGSNRIIRRGSWRIHPGPITVRFGSPITIDTARAGSVEALMDETRARLLGLLGEPGPEPRRHPAG